MADWGFLTNHGRALLCIADDPGVRLRDIAASLGITERRAHAIVGDLAAAGYVVKQRDGRRNRYVVQDHLPLPETTVRERTVGEVLDLLLGRRARRPRPETRGRRRSEEGIAAARRTAARRASGRRDLNPRP